MLGKEFTPPIELAGEPWRVASEVARAVGFRDAKELVRRLSAHQVRRHVVRTKGGPQLVSIVSHEGLRVALGRCRKMNARSVADRLGLGMTWALPIETEALRVISSAVAHLDPRPQYAVGRYHIDLYLCAAKVAIECDELGHADKCARADAERQVFIQAQLGCRFVRFNPQARGFNVGDVINEILVPDRWIGRRPVPLQASHLCAKRVTDDHPFQLELPV